MGSNISKTGPPDVVVDRTLYFVPNSCKSESTTQKFCTANNKPCIHARTLFRCLLTSKQTFAVAARYLWMNYATFDHLAKFIQHPGLENDNCCRGVSVSQVETWMRYSKYITSVELKLEPERIQNDVLTIMEVSALMDDVILPNLQTLTIIFTGDHSAGAHLLVMLLLSTSTTVFNVHFSHTPSTGTLYRFLRVALSKTGPSLAFLRLRNKGQHQLAPDGYHPAESNECFIIHPSLSTLLSFANLETLAIHPAWVTVEVLDVLGSMPKLCELLLDRIDNQYGPVRFNTPGEPRRRENKFSQLLILLIHANLLTLNYLSDAFFASNPQFPIKCLQLTSDDVKFSPREFAFLNAVPHIQILSLMFFRATKNGVDGVTQLTGNCFHGLKSCTSLSNLAIYSDHFKSFRLPAVKDFLSCLNSNLQVLSLQFGRSLSMSDLTNFTNPQDASTFNYAASPSILDLSTLGLIAHHTPRLTELEINLAASETGLLESRPVRLRSLKKLQLGTSFLNWKLPSFDSHQACRYISAVITTETSFSMRRLQDFRGPWKEYAEGYNSFATVFTNVVTRYQEVRRDEVISYTSSA